MNGDKTSVTHGYLHDKFEQVRQIMENNLGGINKSIDEHKKANESSHEHIRTDIRELRASDAEHTKSIGTIKVSLTGMKTDVSWLKRFFWVVAISSIGAFATGVANLLFLYK